MHNHNKDQPSISLPGLSEWHRVPTGAIIPAYVPYAYTYNGGSGIVIELDGPSCDTTVYEEPFPLYTEHPITPPLPTEEGATIMVSSGDWPPSSLLIREGDRWVSCFGVEWSVDQITSWAPVTIGETVVVRP